MQNYISQLGPETSKICDMHIVYRACPVEAEGSNRPGRPQYFNKFSCFNSLDAAIKKASENFDIDITVLIDSDDESPLEAHIKDLGYNVERQALLSNEASLNWQLDFAKDLKCKNIYLLEDDYLHLDGAITTLLEGCDAFGLVTGYDHPDRYTRNDDAEYSKETRLGSRGYWRTTESTTCSWAAKKQVFDFIYPQAKRFVLNDRELFRSLIKSNILLWSTMPGVCTHMMEPFLSPFINWESVNKNNQNILA